MKHIIERILYLLEPYTRLAAYLSICASAVFAWVHPISIPNYFGGNDSLIQAILFTVGGLLCVAGHLSKIIIVELLGLIPSVFGSYVFLYIAIAHMYATNDPNLGLIATYIATAMFMLVNRAFKVQHDISSKWLKPDVTHLYNNNQ